MTYGAFSGDAALLTSPHGAPQYEIDVDDDGIGASQTTPRYLITICKIGNRIITRIVRVRLFLKIFDQSISHTTIKKAAIDYKSPFDPHDIDLSC